MGSSQLGHGIWMVNSSTYFSSLASLLLFFILLSITFWIGGGRVECHFPHLKHRMWCLFTNIIFYELKYLVVTELLRVTEQLIGCLAGVYWILRWMLFLCPGIISSHPIVYFFIFTIFSSSLIKEIMN